MAKAIPDTELTDQQPRHKQAKKGREDMVPTETRWDYGPYGLDEAVEVHPEIAAAGGGNKSGQVHRRYLKVTMRSRRDRAINVSILNKLMTDLVLRAQI